MLVPEEVLVKCTASARKLFDQIVRDRGLNSSLPCNHFDNIIQRTRERDVHPISKDDFINYLKPSSGKLKLAGKSSFTILMISRKYYMKVGRRYIHVASLLQKTKEKQQKGKGEKGREKKEKISGKGKQGRNEKRISQRERAALARESKQENKQSKSGYYENLEMDVDLDNGNDICVDDGLELVETVEPVRMLWREEEEEEEEEGMVMDDEEDITDQQENESLVSCVQENCLLSRILPGEKRMKSTIVFCSMPMTVILTWLVRRCVDGERMEWMMAKMIMQVRGGVWRNN